MSALWNPTNVTVILGVAFVPALVLIVVCFRECMHRKAPFFSVHTAQAIASVMHLLNLLMFMLFTAVPADMMPGGCEFVAIIAPIFFGIMQPLLAFVLITRATSVLPHSFGHRRGSLAWWRSRTGMRVAIGFIFLCGYLTVMTASFLNVRGRNPVTNRCLHIPRASINIPGKVVIMCSYALVGLVFASTLTKHINAMHQTSGTVNHATGVNVSVPAKSSDATQQQLTRVLRGVTGRILLAVLTYLVTIIIGFANGFVNGAYVQFTIENTAAVLAGTFATHSRKFDEKKRSESSSAGWPGSTTAVAATKQSSTAGKKA